MTTTDGLLDSLAQLRQRDLRSPTTGKTFPHTGGLTFSRAWELAQHPTAMTETERVHVEGCRQCDRLQKSAKIEWLRVSGSDESVALRPSAKRLSPELALARSFSDGGKSMTSPHELEAPLQDRLSKLHPHFRNVTVLPGWDSSVARYMDEDTWNERIQSFGSAACERLGTLLAKTNRVGVSWGETIASAVLGLKEYFPLPPRRAGPTMCVATVGGVVSALHIRTENSASLLAIELAETINGNSKRAFPLHNVPALISYPKESEKVEVIQDYIANMENHKAIFNRGGEDGLASDLEAILTSCRDSNDPSDFWVNELERMGVAKKELERIAYGDIGGVLLKRDDISPDDKVYKDILSRWTGITVEHYQSCASKEPGVILLALARNKADIVRKCVEKGLVSELIIDSDLAIALNGNLRRGKTDTDR